MRQCGSCGFEALEEGKPCPICSSTQHSATIVGAPPVSVSPNSFQAIGPTPVASPPSVEITDRKEQPTNPGSGKRLGVYQKGYIYADRYRIEELIGRGGMGSVYRVYDQNENRILALKTLNQYNAGEEDGEQRFMREIHVLSKIKHPGVPAIYGWGRHEEELYFVGEFISGRDLKSEIKKRGPWPPEEAAKLAATIADALAVAHSMGIVHRDVKPHNIMIANDGSIKLLDFGVARRTGAGMETLTKTGMIVGTPEYMSPEQFGTHRVDERSDLYSLGAVLFELLTAEIPFGGETPVAIAVKVIQEPPPPPRSRRRDIPEWLDRIVLKCLEKDPKNRFINAVQLAEALRTQRSKSKPTMRRLPNGDTVMEDSGDTAKFPLVLSSVAEKDLWTIGMALHFSDKFYRLDEIISPTDRNPRWSYQFSFWPEGEILRGLTNYDQHSVQATQAKKSFFKKIFGS